MSAKMSGNEHENEHENGMKNEYEKCPVSLYLCKYQSGSTVMNAYAHYEQNLIITSNFKIETVRQIPSLIASLASKKCQLVFHHQYAKFH